MIVGFGTNFLGPEGGCFIAVCNKIIWVSAIIWLQRKDLHVIDFNQDCAKMEQRSHIGQEKFNEKIYLSLVYPNHLNILVFYNSKIFRQLLAMSNTYSSIQFFMYQYTNNLPN